MKKARKSAPTRRGVLVCALAAAGSAAAQQKSLDLGAFSISLAVKDLQVSRQFYEKLGFSRTGGNGKSFVIMKNGNAVIGLFQGMFKNNILTFNPGWNQSAEKLASFTDVRDLQKQLKAQGLQMAVTADESTKGPAFFVVMDPDGNQVMVDQHV